MIKGRKIGGISFLITIIVSITFLLIVKQYQIQISFNKWLAYVCACFLISIEYLLVSGAQTRTKKIPVMIHGKSIAAIILIINIIGYLWPHYSTLDAVSRGEKTSNDIYKYRLSEEFSYLEQTASYKRLLIDNKIGDILIKDSQDNRLKVEAKVYIETNDQDAVTSFLQNPISIEKSQNIIIRAHQTAVPEEIASKPKINYIIYVPKTVELEISGGDGNINVSLMESDVLIKKNNGNVKVSLTKGNIDINNSYGRVDLAEIEGNVIVNNQHGKITAYNISGTGSFKTTFKSIEVEKIRGKTVVDTTNARVSVIDAQSDVEVATTFGRAELSDVNGNIKVRNNNGDVFVSRIQGTVDILTSFGMIKINEVYYDVRAITTHEDVVVTLDKDVSSNFRLETNYSDIYFFSPAIENAQMNLFTAQYGIIEGDYVLDIESKGDDLSSYTLLGGGDYKINIKNFYGNIFIRIR